MQENKKSGLFCCGPNLRKLRFYQAMRHISLYLYIGSGLSSICLVSSAFAAICFLPDCKDKEIVVGPTGVDECLAAGYESYSTRICPDNSNIIFCPENSSYIKCDLLQWCLDNNYSIVPDDCQIPEYVDEQCPNGEALYKYCKPDYEKACLDEDENYVINCPDGWILDKNELCSYSSLYGKCCNLCTDYLYEKDKIPEGYISSESCQACGGGMRYKIEPDPCIGYQKCSDAPKSGTPECRHGNETWYKECCAYDCTLDECPAGTDCNYEVCSNKYCIVGCLVDYTDYCQEPVIDCAALGYTATSCSERKLVCPHDKTKYFCM